MHFDYCLTDENNSDRFREIDEPLNRYSQILAGPGGHRALVVTLRDASGCACGGLWGVTAWGWLFINSLYVPDDARSRGVGRRLMAAAEAEAVTRGCIHAYVETFQARDFYTRLDYVCFAEQADCPRGFTRSFFQKALPISS